MKSIFAIVILALAANVHSSFLTAQVAPGVSYVTHDAVFPYGGAWHGAYGAVDFSAGAPWGYAGHGAWGGYPGIGLSQGPGYGHGVYVAKTRGAVHTAPLAGHVNSATSVNVAPAPGTH